MHKGRDQIRAAYRQETVAQEYIDERFVEPPGALLHTRQVRYLRDTLAEARPASVLEIAPGPARLTTELVTDLPARTVVLDASRQMFDVARQRLDGRAPASWAFLQGDAFKLPFRAK